MHQPAPRLPLWAVPPLAALALAFVVAFALSAGAAADDVLVRGAAALAGVGAVCIGLSVRPAWSLSLGIAFTVFSGNWDLIGSPLPLDRLLLITGILATLLHERARDPYALRTRPVDWLLLVVALYAVLSAVFAGTLDDHTARFALIDRYSLLGFVLFFVAPKAFREARDREILLGTLVALGAYLGVTAVLETTGPRALIVPGYINDPSVGIHFDRARGPFVEAAANGLALFSCGVASVLAALSWDGRRKKQIAWLVAALCALGVLLTVTRAAWIASSAATLLTLLAMREARRFVVPAAVLVGAGVLIAFATIPGLASRADQRADDKPPIWDRNNSNAAALRMLDDRPVLGYGWGKFPDESFDYYRQSPDYPLTGVRHLHNTYLSNAVELGLLGALLWLVGIGIALIGSVVRRGPPELRPWKLGLIAIMASAALSGLSTPFGYALPTLLLWTWAGIARGEDVRTAPR